jgi:hypothetical protein
VEAVHGRNHREALAPAFGDQGGKGLGQARLPGRGRAGDPEQEAPARCVDGR